MTDRELLERAAKAAGIELTGGWVESGGMLFGFCRDAQDVQHFPWAPLHDDGDAARLEGTLLMNVSWGMASVSVDSCTERFSDHSGDKQKARRYAGVRAAAAMAEGK